MLHYEQHSFSNTKPHVCSQNAATLLAHRVSMLYRGIKLTQSSQLLYDISLTHDTS